MKIILEKAELRGAHIYINDELVATKNMIGKNGEANAKRIVHIINMHNELVKSLSQILHAFYNDEPKGYRGSYYSGIKKIYASDVEKAEQLLEQVSDYLILNSK